MKPNDICEHGRVYRTCVGCGWAQIDERLARWYEHENDRLANMQPVRRSA